jgi:hypothetical protein
VLAEGGRDVPRNLDGLALICDPRNGVHLFVNQLHVAFLLARNLLVDRLRDHGLAAPDVFEDARRATMWHYEWVLLYDYLPGLVGLELGRRPTLPAADGNRYSFADLLTIRTLTGET